MIQSNLLSQLESTPELTRSNLQIIACAGAGKTEFISTRIAFLVAKGLAKPENVVAFTFTERAAEELKFRIRSKIRELVGHQPDVGDLYVGTIHSFCYELLKEFQPGFRAFDVLDEGKRHAFLSSIRYKLGYDELLLWLEDNKRRPWKTARPAWLVKTLMQSIDMVREEMTSVEQVAACEAFVKAMQRYDETLHERRFLDFSSMMALAIQYLEEDENMLRAVREKYTHITVDEYQDVNPIQERLIEILVGETGNLCVVGDDDQSIYQWRGSTVDNILTFKERYKNVHTHYLPTNYRSTEGIITLSNHLISKNQRRLPKSMNATDKSSERGDIYKLVFETQEEEIRFMVERIKSLVETESLDKDGHARGLAYSDIAIFFRSVRYDAQPYLDALKAADIPYAVSGIGGLFEAPEVDLIFSIFSYLGEFGKNWDGVKGKIPDEIEIYHQAKACFIIPEEQRFVRALHQLKEATRAKRRLPLQELYARILMLLGLADETLHDERHELKLYNLGMLSQAISDFEGIRTYTTWRDIKRLCWFIRTYAQSSYDAGAGEDPTLCLNAVQVMTLHATKGLGFPAVFMPYCVERRKHQTDTGFLDPEKFDFTRYEGSVEDARRLFYVGLTRAKKFLFVTTSRIPQGKKNKKTILRFFHELDDSLCLTEPLPDPAVRKKRPLQPSLDDYRFPTNYSELSDYIRCEYDYKLRYIYGFNPVIVQALGYGRQIHNILNILNKRTQQFRRLPTEQEVAEIVSQHFYLRYAASEQEEILKRSALWSVLRYLEMWHEDLSLSVKAERSFEMDFDNALLSGTIDLLRRENGQTNILEIIDFKTGSQRKNMEELELQVQLYTLAAREALNLNVEKAYVHFLDDKKQNRLKVLTTPKQLEWARRTITDAVHGITHRRFRRNPRNRGVCEVCDWERICPKRNGN